MLPPLVLYVTLFVALLVTVALNACCPGAMVWLAGVTGVIVTLVGVAVKFVETLFPPVPVTGRV
jgi:hypothetical protein